MYCNMLKYHDLVWMVPVFRFEMQVFFVRIILKITILLTII